MNVGILKETKPEEFRVPLTPEAVGRLVESGHDVLVQEEAGVIAGFPDAAYEAAGADMQSSAEDITGRADIVVKVKEPLPDEFDLYREFQTLCCFIKVKSEKELMDTLVSKNMTAISFQHIREKDGVFPLLAPMSTIAGQQAVLQGMQFLWNHNNGIGKSIIPYPGLEPFQVVILGGGVVGIHAAKVAAALGAQVNIFEVDQNRIEELDRDMPAGVRVLNLAHVLLVPYLRAADMLINTATIPPNSSFHIVSREMVAKMKKGSIIVDVTANIRGAVETIDRQTTHKKPVWEVDGVFHYAVRNIPGTVAHTASRALSMALMPYLSEAVNLGVAKAVKSIPALARGAVVVDGKVK